MNDKGSWKKNNVRLNHLFDVYAQRLVRVDREKQVSDIRVDEIPMVAKLHVVQQRSLGQSHYNDFETRGKPFESAQKIEWSHTSCK